VIENVRFNIDTLKQERSPIECNQSSGKENHFVIEVSEALTSMLFLTLLHSHPLRPPPHPLLPPLSLLEKRAIESAVLEIVLKCHL
jgi:hypothetical protein